MWLVRALVQLLERVVVGVVVAVLLALVFALARGGGFRHAFDIACWSVGVLAILMGAVGQSPSSRTYLDRHSRVGMLPARFQSRPGDTTISTSAVFFLTGAVLIVLGVVLA